MDKAREHWIIGRALYEAVARLERLPDEQRPESDIEDMRELLAEQYVGVWDALVARGDHRPPPEPVVKLVPNATPPEDDTTA
jgi:hypothetical protein